MKMGGETITDCCFDLYGTLIDIHTEEGKPCVWEAVEKKIREWNPKVSVSRETMSELFYAQLYRDIEKGKKGLKQGEYFEPEFASPFTALLTACGIEGRQEQVAEIAKVFRIASTEYCKLYEGAVEFLLALKEKGYRLWVISNAQTLFTVPELEHLGISSLFDGIYISSAAGCKKPDLRFFAKAMKENGIDPDHAVMIGNDGICDIKGGRESGMRTIYFRTNLSPEEPDPKASLILEGADYKAAFAWITGEE